MKNWYVIHALSNQEFRAKLNLQRQNYFVYNLLLTILVTLLTVYTIKTFFYFSNNHH